MNYEKTKFNSKSLTFILKTRDFFRFWDIKKYFYTGCFKRKVSEPATMFTKNKKSGNPEILPTTTMNNLALSSVVIYAQYHVHSYSRSKIWLSMQQFCFIIKHYYLNVHSYAKQTM